MVTSLMAVARVGILLFIYAINIVSSSSSSPSSVRYIEVCSVSQIVELVFNSTSGRYEYWDVPQSDEDGDSNNGISIPPTDEGNDDDDEEEDVVVDAEGNDDDSNNSKSNNTPSSSSPSSSSSTLGGEYDGETSTMNGSTSSTNNHTALRRGDDVNKTSTSSTNNSNTMTSVSPSPNTYDSGPPPDPSDYFYPKISAGRFRKCTCYRQFFPTEEDQNNRTDTTGNHSVDESQRTNIINGNTNSDEVMDVVCPMEADMCAIPVDDDGKMVSTTTTTTAQCFIPDKRSVSIIRTVWPVLLLWYASFLIVVISSYRGRQVVLFCFRWTCCPQINDRLASRIIQQQDRQRDERRRQLRQLQRRLSRRNRLVLDDTSHVDDYDGDDDDNNRVNSESSSRFSFWSAPRRYNRNDQDGRVTRMDRRQNYSFRRPSNAPQPTKELILRTKLYRQPEGCCVIIETHDTSVNLDDDVDDVGRNNNSSTNEQDTSSAQCCTICFVDFEDGDRIGDLECRHLYHVSCLKKWIGRKNSCPLCSSTIATTIPHISVIEVEIWL